MNRYVSVPLILSDAQRSRRAANDQHSPFDRLRASGTQWFCFVLALLVPALSYAAIGDAYSGADARNPMSIEVDEHLGQSVPLDLRFINQDGQSVRLGDYLADGKPLVLTMAYFHCPMLCDMVLRDIGQGFSKFGFTLGKEYRALTISIDPTDTAPEARLKQGQLMQAMNRPEAASSWPFLTGAELSIVSLTQRLGYRYVYDPKTKQYAHPAVTIVLSPTGKITRYLYGVPFSTRDLRLALDEAAQGTIGTLVDRVLMTCFRYDPTTRRYGLLVKGVMKGGAAFFGALVFGLLAIMWRLERTRRSQV